MACIRVGRGNRPLRLRLRLGFGAGLRLSLRLRFGLGRFGLNDIGRFVLPFHRFDLRALFWHGLGRLRFGLFRFGRFGQGLLRWPGGRLVFGYGVATRTAATPAAANLGSSGGLIEVSSQYSRAWAATTNKSAIGDKRRFSFCMIGRHISANYFCLQVVFICLLKVAGTSGERMFGQNEMRGRAI